MKQGLRLCAVSVLCLSILLMFNALSFCQEVTGVPDAAEGQVAPVEDSWLWGEVVSLDLAVGKIVLKYIDYESDSEKETSVYTSSETTYENVSGLSQIKPEDTVSVDYVAARDGKITAKHISVEKLEAVSDEGAELPSDPEMSE